MKESEWVPFLQWALPQLGLRWAGFRKVRRQVCKRIHRRMRELDRPTVQAYTTYLENCPAEWSVLDELCRVTISRFYRDKGLFAFLEDQVLPKVAWLAKVRGEKVLRVWSAGCGSGEEPYSLALVWRLCLESRFAGMEIRILATDADATMIRRGKEACYSAGSLKELPWDWREAAFTEAHGQYCLRQPYRRDVTFLRQDVRVDRPAGLFHLILCRNMAFTYFDHQVQLEVAERLRTSLYAGGALVVGAHEALAKEAAGFLPWPGNQAVYRKTADGKPEGKHAGPTSAQNRPSTRPGRSVSKVGRVGVQAIR